MKKILRIAGVTLVVLLAWAAFVAVASLEGWWHETLARPADTRAFMQAAVRNLEAAKVGNAVLAVMENGSVFEKNISIGKPVTPNTLFQVASMSKWVSAWGVMALVENGKIDLDEPVSAYLTRWQIPPSEFDTDGITVRRLLSHTAGFSDGLGYGGFAPGEQLQTLEESLTRAADAVPIRSMTVGHEPGEKYAYSGGGYTLLQLLIEEVTGLGFETYMRQTIFEPLGMTQSTFDWQKANAGDLADFYDTDGSITTHYRYTALAAASLYTTVRDMTRFLQAHCSNERGEAPGRGVLAPETLLLMRQPHASPGLMQLWVDFSAYPVGTELTMQSLPFSAGRVGEWPWGVPHSRLERMSLEQFGAIRSGEEQPEIDPEGYTVFKVRVDREDDTAPLAIPQELSRIETLDPAAAANRDNPRSFNFSERASQMFINGPQFKMESVAEDEIVQLNTTEMWEFINVSGSSGGIHHVHGLQFQIIERSVDDVEESGWGPSRRGSWTKVGKIPCCSPQPCGRKFFYASRITWGSLSTTATTYRTAMQA